MFEFKWSRQRLGLLIRVLVGISMFAGFLLLLFWSSAEPWIRSYEPMFKLVGYVFAPIFATLGFIMSRYDKLELEEKSQQLGIARKEAADAAKKSDKARADLEIKAAEARRLFLELEGITTGADQLWRLRPPRPFPFFRQWFNEPEGAKLITIGNLKGGVGKTTLAANFAAYVSETLHKRVLLVDLDYQGSLSTLVLQAIGREETGSQVNALFGSASLLSDVLTARVHLVPLSDDVKCRLSQGWLIPSDYEYSRLENQLLLSWLLNRDEDIDVRYRLAHSLLNPDVRNDYDLIIFDMPPRMTMGSINALVASHYFFVPTGLSKLSVEAVPQFLQNVKAIREDLGLGISLAGIIGNLTRQLALSEAERLHLERAREAGEVWSKEVGSYVLPQTVPRRTAIAEAEGSTIAYLTTDPKDRQDIHSILDPLFHEMAQRIGLIKPI